MCEVKSVTPEEATSTLYSPYEDVVPETWTIGEMDPTRR